MRNSRPTPPRDTAGEDYTERLRRLGGARWKRLLDVQAPYRWNLRRLRLGRTLDVGSGLGRNLANLDGNGVGVDHNRTSVEHTRAAGFEAYTVEEFPHSPHARPGAFDSLLAAHLLEHLPADQAREVVASYLPYVRSGGTAVFITPQERGYASDASHVRFVGFAEAAQTCRELGLTVTRQFSFPFPRSLGRLFTYNEFVTVARVP
ncbi:methyltransferase domain-containing protein [Micromonospora sp. RHAY321]|uniref:methyltransferase domain-containing protein n=1 Tax=Micromonospora sp. RHAY321 TaxID=2944807 RepID=UPI00207CCEF3|nr:methyltransferase domain-containing protein [Micromonospora sp. RHAY321]MCO1596926.1 methyltransferase domain-containing protein [Micromonospora sp. RHAY321]